MHPLVLVGTCSLENLDFGFLCSSHLAKGTLPFNLSSSLDSHIYDGISDWRSLSDTYGLPLKLGPPITNLKSLLVESLGSALH